MSKSDKMYSKSPKIEKDENGKASIKKPSEADAEDMAVEDNPKEMPVDVQEIERHDMAKKHVQELKDMHKRHSDDFEKMHGRHAMARGSELKDTPAKEVKETE